MAAWKVSPGPLYGEEDKAAVRLRLSTPATRRTISEQAGGSDRRGDQDLAGKVQKAVADKDIKALVSARTWYMFPQRGEGSEIDNKGGVYRSDKAKCLQRAC